MQEAGLHECLGPARVDRLWEAFEPVTHDDAHIGDTPVFNLREYLQPVFSALTTLAGPQAENVTLTGDSDP